MKQNKYRLIYDVFLVLWLVILDEFEGISADMPSFYAQSKADYVIM